MITPYISSDAPGRARRIVQHGDILWSCVRPNRRSYALVMQPMQNAIASTGFAVLTATKVPFAFLYQAVTTDDFVAYLTNIRHAIAPRAAQMIRAVGAHWSDGSMTWGVAPC